MYVLELHREGLFGHVPGYSDGKKHMSDCRYSDIICKVSECGQHPENVRLTRKMSESARKMSESF